MNARQLIPQREEIPEKDRWDLSLLFKSDGEWETGLAEFQAMIPEIENFQGKLGNSAAELLQCMQFMNKVELLDERLGYYAHLRHSENAGNAENQDRFGRYMNASSKASAAGSFITPEIQAIPGDRMESFLADPILEDFVIALKKILRFKPYILSKNEEKLMALQIEANQTASRTFEALTDVDLDFGTVDTPQGPKPLSQSSFAAFMLDPDREIREKAYLQFYSHFNGHKNTLSSLYAGSVHLDIYRARARKYPSALSMALFPDKVPESVYTNLIESVTAELPSLHRYYTLRKKILGVDTLRHYDVYVPLVKDISMRHTFDQAVEATLEALSPLGDEYCAVLRKGLTGRWVDRYENKGKQSGAFSAGSYAGEPYILMNFKEEVLRDVFTLAHESGHSMHSWYSVRNNPFQHYHYTIFEAEVASTFNEQLLADYFLKKYNDTATRAYLIGKQADDIIGTIFRQTMFAEFEKIIHETAENGAALTVDSIRQEYRRLLGKYFGPEMVLEETSDLEGMRIPHFYRAFYVYKYATGLSAAIALAERVITGGKGDKEAYLTFLKSGGSRYPIEALKMAGVDMSEPEPVRRALQRFQTLVTEMEELLTKI